MKTWFVAVTLALAGTLLATAPHEAEARRLGGGKPAGMQRQAPPSKPADAAPAPQPAPPAAQNAGAQSAAPAAAAAVPPKAPAATGGRSWMGPLAGLAAGIGIAALMQHLGMGEAFGNILTMLLLAAVAFFAIRWVMRRMSGGRARAAAPGGMQFAGAGAPYPDAVREQAPPVLARSMTAPESASSSASQLGSVQAVEHAGANVAPSGFDAAGFERIAKMLFIRLQAANDTGEIDDLRKFTTPELFASLRLDLQERQGSRQQTDVLQLDAEVVETTREGSDWIASVRFHGLIREAESAGAEAFDEIWHFTKPVAGDRDWAIAGITPLAEVQH